MNDEFAINKRIQQVMQEKGLTNTMFAEAIGVNKSSISQLLAERNKPSLDFLEKLLRTYNDVDANWLLRGESSSVKKEPVQIELFPEVDSSNVISETRVVEKEKSNFLEAETAKNRVISGENPNQEKIIEKIVTFYSDKSFEVYKPV
ncbi:MAG: helix-turn-helix transcriptional regulator [Bacteroidales bacterium]|nr:helix-turn-helix transcriptional regulator [Bacteroidales bacterium]